MADSQSGTAPVGAQAALARGGPAPELARRRIWVDGRLVAWEQATLHVFAQSVQRGSLIFDVMSCRWMEAGPAVFGLREHLERFLGSARLSGMKLALSIEELASAIAETVHANPGATQVKISGYYPSPSLDVLPRDAWASVAIAAYCPEEIAPGAVATRNATATLQVADLRKMPAWVMSPQAKLAAGYLYTSVAKSHARSSGFDDVLLLDEAGNLAESSTQSFFWVRDGALYTAPAEVVLEGVTRRVVMELARDEGIAVHETKQPRAVLEAAQEVFLTGSTVGVWPVSRIDAQTWPAPGPVSARLAERFRQVLAGRDAVFSPRWLQPV